MNNETNLDPEAIVLSKVYALLIRAARKKKAEEQQSDSRAKADHQGPHNHEGPYPATSLLTE